MSDLANQTPASTYKGLLQVNDYTNGVDGTSKFVQDGEGTDSALSVSTTKVGVGTASPTQELDVNGNIVATTLTTSGAVTAGSVSTSGAVGAGSVDVNGNVVADEYALDQTGASSSAVAIHAPASNELAIRTNSTEAMRIDSDGKVGIGTTSPARPLSIFSSTTDSVALRLTNQSDTSYYADYANGFIKAYGSSTSFKIILNDDEKIRIKDNGNVGIGTGNPSAPLEVSSTTGGVIMPRMNTTQRTAISSPTPGEMVYDTDLNKFYGYTSSGWTALH